MDVKDFSYELPKELIAQDPLADRSSSRLMLLDRVSGETEEARFKDIVSYLSEGDCLVLNNTKVIPARLFGVRKETGGQVEVLLLKRLSEETGQQCGDALKRLSEETGQQCGDTLKRLSEESGQQCGDTLKDTGSVLHQSCVWETLVKPGKKARPGTRLVFGDGLLEAEVLEVVEDGNRRIRFCYDGIFEEVLDQLGEMPLPPYITHKLKEKNRYQTVYAKYDGSAAAPTAGLHFTPELLSEIREKGVRIAEVTLHVGLGTFRPVKVENVTEHHMHSEYYEITKEAADTINEVKKNGGRIICVGTTSCRTLESAADDNGCLAPCSGWTDIFIYPGYRFKIMDALITNFHLPESTLLMLVSAFAGREHVLAAYEKAVEEKFRFFSFGDAMFLS